MRPFSIGAEGSQGFRLVVFVGRHRFFRIDGLFLLLGAGFVAEVVDIVVHLFAGAGFERGGGGFFFGHDGVGSSVVRETLESAGGSVGRGRGTAEGARIIFAGAGGLAGARGSAGGVRWSALSVGGAAPHYFASRP